MTVSLRFSIILLFVCLFANVCFAQKAVAETDATKKDAERIWELAIQAKGGRDKLLTVDNLLVQEGNPYDKLLKGRNVGYEVSLLVFPYKSWSWNDTRPSVFGLAVRMDNEETKMYYQMTPDDPAKGLKQMLPPTPEQDINLTYHQLVYFMETKWIKPIPLKVREGKSHNKLADIVEVMANGKRWEFFLDVETHLPFQIDWFYTIKGADQSSSNYLSDYTEVKGIKVPQNVVWEYGEKSPSQIQISVNYDENIFTAPTKIEDGPNAWQGTNVNQMKSESPSETKQIKSTASGGEINNLVRQVADKNPDKRGEALDKLSEIGQPAVPFLIAQLSDKRKLVVVWTAQTLLEIAPDNQEAVSALLKILKSGKGLTERSAAFAMTSSTSGIRQLADLLEDKNTFIRQSVAFAFDNLTERDLSPEELKAMEYAEPKLKNAVNDKNEIVSDMASEVLNQLGRRKK